MKRPILLSLFLFGTDQFLKYFFQYNFINKKILFSKGFGLTYITNPGLYISFHISDLSILLLQMLVILTLIFVLISMYNFKSTFTGGTLLIDLSFAFLFTALTGNLIFDKLMFGFIRDYLILPMGIANFADFCGLISLILFSIKVYESKEMRQLLFKQKNTTKAIMPKN